MELKKSSIFKIKYEIKLFFTINIYIKTIFENKNKIIKKIKKINKNLVKKMNYINLTSTILVHLPKSVLLNLI